MRKPAHPAFAALAGLAGRVRPATATPAAQARPPEPGAAEADAAARALFHAAVGDATVLAPDGRAVLERPRPAPLPRPRPAEPEPEAAPARRADPGDDPSLQFRAAVGDVVRLPDSGRVELGRRPPRVPVPARTPDGSPADAGETPIRLPDLDDPAALFQHVVGAAHALPDRNRALLERTPPPPRPIQFERDEAAALRESIEAPISFQDRLDTGDESVFLRAGLPRRILTDLRRGRWVVQGEIDLHGMTRDEARSALGHFLAEALDGGRRCVRVIHGKGLGSPGRQPVLKQLSRGWLMQRAEILAFCQARPHDGGEGALLVLLRNHGKTG